MRGSGVDRRLHPLRRRRAPHRRPRVDRRRQPGICASYAAGAVRCDGRADDHRHRRRAGHVQHRADRRRHRHDARRSIRPAWRRRPTSPGSMLAVHERMTDVRGAAIAGRVGERRPHRDRRTVAGPRAHRPCRRVHQEPRRAVSARGAARDRRHARPPASARRSSRSARPGAATLGTCGCRGRRARRGRGSCGASARPTWRPTPRSRSRTSRAAVLPRFASEPHKDTRAPQNLYPIGGLERELRHRFGDQALLFRSLQRAAAA